MILSSFKSTNQWHILNAIVKKRYKKMLQREYQLKLKKLENPKEPFCEINEELL